MRLTTRCRYALSALVDLASQDVLPTSLGAIAKRTALPLPYLEQIFTTLKARGYVDGTRGPGGGYRLARPASHISVKDVISAMGQSLKMTRCQSGVWCGPNKNGPCSTHFLLKGLERQLQTYLSSISIEDMAKPRATTQSPSCGSGCKAC